MRNIRLIPRLDVKKEWLIKGVQMEGWRKVGDPVDAAISYSKQGADEIIFLDVVASLYKRNNLVDIVKKVARSVFIPLTVGGGIRKLSDVRLLLANGADKITLNTGAVENPCLVSEISDMFGSQATVVSIEAVQRQHNQWEVMTDNGRNRTNKDAVEWAKQVESLGAGEILLTSIDNDGMGNGYNLELIKRITNEVNIPVLASGGLSNPSHLQELIKLTEASAAISAKALHMKETNIAELNEVVIQNGCCRRNINN
tara:strand:- start:591 stop:1358 length:768 start_codon:yes stop_codon:yes gene_type:complete